jgi:multidrug transporter EmrE-like cation transporter
MTLFHSYLFLGLAIVVEVIGTTALKATRAHQGLSD